MHIAELRTARTAQWEIRRLAQTIVGLVLEDAPELEVVFEAMSKRRKK